MTKKHHIFAIFLALGVWAIVVSAPALAAASGGQSFGQAFATPALAAPALASPALAQVSGEHVFSGTLGSPGSGAGEFSEPAGVAVNEETNDVYVVDSGNDRVEYFSAAGKFEGEFNGRHLSGTGSGTLTEGSTTIEAVTTETGAFKGGEEISAPGLPAGTTISSVEGDVLIVSKAATASELASPLTTHQSLSEPAGIAVDNDPLSPSHGDVYVIDINNEVIDKFNSSGTYLGQITEAEPGSEPFSQHIPEESVQLIGVAVAGDGELLLEYKRRPSGQGSSETHYDDHIVSYSDKEPNVFAASSIAEVVDYEEVNFPGGGFAVDSKENRYAIYNGYPGFVAKLNSQGKLSGETSAEKRANSDFCGKQTGYTEASALAVEQSSDDVYIEKGSVVDRCSESGALIESLGSGLLQDGSGMAVNLQTGDVYVADAAADVVDVFSVPAAPEEPKISEEAVVNVRATAATLQAQINPHKASTTYHFEYDTSPYTSSASHGTSLPIPNGDAGSGERAIPVSVELVGLRPGTTYYYRVVAESEVGGAPKLVDGEGEAFTTNALPSSPPETCPNAAARSEQPFDLTLPDCRAYEMVSPLDKNDNDAVLASYNAARSSLSGEAITYESPGIFAGAEGGDITNQYLARRGPDGWYNEAITPPAEGNTGVGGAYRAMAFTPELSDGITMTDTPLAGDAIAGYKNLYLADFATAPVSYQVVTSEPHITAETNGQPEVVGVTVNLNDVIYKELDENVKHAYEWVEGEVRPLAGAGGGGEQPGADSSDFDDSWRSVSSDGSRVFFTTQLGASPEAQETDRQLAVEENPTSSTEDCSVEGDKCVLELSKSQRVPEDPLGPGSARFRGASVSGSRVFFTDCSKLTKDATAVTNSRKTTCYPEVGTGNDLYEYDFEKPEGERLTDLTVDTLPSDPLGARVVGVPYISEDGSHVYFVAEGQLTGENAEGKQPVSGEPNLYLDHLEGGTWTTSFISTLAPSTRGGTGLSPPEGGDSDDWNQISPLDTVSATPDGTHLAFLSQRSLTGFDNEQAEAGECETNDVPTYSGSEGGECREVFSYDAVLQKLVCVSCDSTGARPVGPSSLEEGEHAYPSEQMGYTRRNFSESGTRLFFDSEDALVPHDSNGRQNVYEWERDGDGSCQQDEGCVYEISDVAGDYSSFFLDADAKGENVFFATADQLVPSDTDNHVDVYDARVGGGFPVSPSPPECDNADSCKPPVSPQPAIFGAPSSATFSGPGNLASEAAKPAVKSKTAAQVKAEKLAAALRTCRKVRAKKKRASCEKQAREKYVVAKKKARKDKKARKASIGTTNRRAGR